MNDHPSLVRYRCCVGAMYEQGYFAGATLLYHVAGNPDRGPLPQNILDIARVLLSRDFDPKAAEFNYRPDLLLVNGASASIVEPRWGGTPADWAEQGGHPETAAIIRNNVI